MEQAVPGHGLTALGEALAEELRRLPDQLRGLAVTRLAEPLPPYASRAEAARDMAQLMADTAAGVEGRELPDPPSYRRAPRLADRACSDQLAVTGTDLLAALRGLPVGTPVWDGAQRASVEDVVRRVVEALVALRRGL